MAHEKALVNWLVVAEHGARETSVAEQRFFSVSSFAAYRRAVEYDHDVLIDGRYVVALVDELWRDRSSLEEHMTPQPPSQEVRHPPPEVSPDLAVHCEVALASATRILDDYERGFVEHVLFAGLRIAAEDGGLFGPIDLRFVLGLGRDLWNQRSTLLAVFRGASEELW
jgi:hypothetical protein